MFKKNLTDLITGIRSHKANEGQYISQCIQEIKEELKSDSKSVKTIAVQKLTYLQMLGYDMKWAAFNVVEVMSFQSFTNKRIAYSAASQSFDENTDVTMLTTNLIKKDFMGKSLYEAGMALTCLGNICTPDLARDLAPDVVSMLTSSRPYIRKKAVLVLYKIFLMFPDALRPSFNRLKDKLEDPDPAVVSAAVNVFCELAKSNPKNYLVLAPTLYKLLSKSSNNWMLIKVIKLFALLAPHEPRLAKKLIEPFTTLINTTAAMSLLFEVIQACICGLSEYEQVMRLCIGKLRTFIEHPDPNLKYLGLLAMNNIMRVFPKGVAEHRDVVVTCLEDEDVTIRMRALDLLSSMVTKKNLGLIVKKLIEHLNNADGSYKDELLEKVIAVCSRDNYAYITDFEWYIATLLELSHVQGTRHGKLVKDQLLDVCVRVHVIRQFAVENMINVLRDPVLLNSNDSMTEVLYAAAFIVGEYASSAEDFLPSLESLLQPRAAALSATVQSIYMQNVLKLVTKLAAFATNASESDENRQKAAHDLDLAIQLIEGRLPLFTRSVHLEVQERACFLEVLLKLLKEQREAKEESHIGEFFVLTDEPLNPVSNKAQRKVQVPQGLDLDAWIIEPAPEEPPMTFDEPRNDKGEWAEWEEEGKAEYRPIDPEERKRQRDARRRNMASNPHYLGEELGLGDDDEDDDNGAPVQRLSGADLGLEEGALSNKYRKPKRGGAAKTKKVYTVMTTEDMPEGSGGDSDEERRSDPSVKNALSGVDLSNISSNETLPVRQHRVVPIDVKKPDPARPKAVTPSPTKTPTPSPAKSPKDDKASDYMLGALGGAKSPTAPLSRTSSSGSTGSGRGTFQEVGSIESPTGRPAPKKAAPQAAPKAAAPVTTADDKLRTKTLVKDDLLEITYTTKVSPKEANKILVVFNFKTKAAPVYHIELHFADHAVLQPVAKSPIFVVASIQANQNHSFRVMFNAQSCVNPLSVSGQLTYLQMPAQAKSGEQAKKDFTLNLPSSSFILPQSLTREGFVKLLTTVPNLSLNATSITSKSLKAAVADILGLFGVSRVEESADRASMYGKTTMGHHVAVLIKEEGGPNSLAVAIKSNDIALGDSLIKELSAFFKA